MATLITTNLGEPLPPYPRHAITVHLPKWQSISRFADRDPELMKSLKSMYPRKFSVVRSLVNLLGEISG